METKNLINDRDTAHKNATESITADDWKIYRKLRNQVTSKLKAEKHKWQQNMLCTAPNSSEMWKNIKGFLGWTNNGTPKQLFDGLKICKKPSELCSIMNNHFINKVKRIRRALPLSNGDPLQLVRKQMEGRDCKFVFKAVHPDTVLKVIASLSNKKSCGTDNIDSYILKLAKHELCPAITHIVNLSLLSGCFPESWKLSLR